MPFTGLRSVALVLLLMSSGVQGASISYDVDQIIDKATSVSQAVGTNAASFRFAFENSNAWVIRHHPGHGQFSMSSLFWTNTAQIMSAIRGLARAGSGAPLRSVAVETVDTVKTVELTEPGSLILLCLGFAGLVLIRRRRLVANSVRA